MNNSKPILFSTPMVQAILQGRKTMTRRAIKSKTGLYQISTANYEPDAAHFYHNHSVDMLDENERDVGSIMCPFGQVGDILWVREATCFVMLDHAPDLLEGMDSQTVYKASVHPDWMKYAKENYGYKWLPSIFMPKEACRIFLKITDIRVERLNEISEPDAKQEGVIPDLINDHPSKQGYLYRFPFRDLWEKINGKESWGKNPWVWVIEFERTTV